MGCWFFSLVVIVLLVLSVGGQVAHLHYAQIGRDAIAAVDHIDVLASATDNMAFEGVGAYCATIFMTATKQSMWRPIRKWPCSKEFTQRRTQSTRTFRDFFCLINDSWRARQNIRVSHHQQQMLPTAGRRPFFFSTCWTFMAWFSSRSAMTRRVDAKGQNLGTCAPILIRRPSLATGRSNSCCLRCE
jgi:hypothetical protein